MRKKRNKFSILFFLLVVGTFLVSTNIDVFATINKENNKNEIIIQAKDNPIEGIFSKKKDGLWEPGKEKTNDFVIKNQGNDNIVLKMIYFNQVKLLDNQGNEVKENEGAYSNFMNNSFLTLYNNGKEVYRGTLKDALSDEGISLKNIDVNANDNKMLNLKFDMSGKADNNSQGLKEEFGLAITYEKDINNEGGNNNGGNDNNNGGTITPDKDGSISGGMPTTGQLIGTTALLVAGIILFLIGIGVIKGSKKEGGKNA